ncbi:MAG: Bax inhibitor-1/YccA family protein [Bacteroides sp.]|nr:Bax inhibitor-1/YccA family protein [Bacteroides sp.]MDE6043128.1 Bax inhibitor-1/YccA family protein [Muribaculaceae bacterium]
MNYNSYPPEYVPADFTTRVSATMKRVYVNMTLALVVTAFVSLWCSNSYAFLNFMVANRWAMWVLLIAEVGLVLGISAGINKLSTATATLLFYIFAVVNGAALSPIFLAYTGASIAKTFFITAGTFGAMSVYGFVTKSDLSKIGSILFMALIGLIIASVVNMFAHSDTLQWIISIAGVMIFVGLTAWDTQQIKRMAEQMPAAGVGRLAVLGALSLYLDFINLFLYLLRFFGSSRD